MPTTLSPTAVDSSGNGNDGSYSGSSPRPRHVAGLVSGDLALATSGSLFDSNNRVAIHHQVFDGSGTFSIVWWQQNSISLNGQEISSWNADSGSDTLLGSSYFGSPNAHFRLRNYGFAADWGTSPNTMPADGLTHFYALVFSGGTPTFYKDGSALSWFYAHGTFPLPACQTFYIGLPASVNVMDELAFFPTALTSGNISSLYSAGLSGFTAWNSSVLSLSPTAFYHLDDEITTTVEPRGLSLVKSGDIDLIGLTKKQG